MSLTNEQAADELEGMVDIVAVLLTAGVRDPSVVITPAGANALLHAVRVFRAEGQLLDSLVAVEWGGTKLDEHSDEVDCCPNCFAPRGGHHFAHCELRDSLDRALGVTSERVVHPAHQAGRARG